MTSTSTDQKPNTPEWRAAEDCTKKHGGGKPIPGQKNKACWRLFVSAVAHEGEADIPAAAKLTVEVLRTVVHDMRTGLGSN